MSPDRLAAVIALLVALQAAGVAGDALISVSAVSAQPAALLTEAAFEALALRADLDVEIADMLGSPGWVGYTATFAGAEIRAAVRP